MKHKDTKAQTKSFTPKRKIAKVKTRNLKPGTRNPGLPGLVCKKYKIEAPELWNYDFGTGTVTKIGCFRGASLGMKKSQI